MEVLLTRSIGTRLGEGLSERGHIADEPMRRTLQAARAHVDAMRPLTNNLHAIATSALRRADNATACTDALREITGADTDIIDGEAEARYAFIGATTGLSAGTYGVADLGGGSTEYAVGEAGCPQRLTSCEVGAVRLTEDHPELAGVRGMVSQDALEAALAQARASLAPVGDFPTAAHLVFVGGSATTIVAMCRHGDPFERATLTREDVLAQLHRLASAPLAERKAFAGMNPQRADILCAGCLIIEALFELTAHDEALVTRQDLLAGYLIERASAYRV